MGCKNEFGVYMKWSEYLWENKILLKRIKKMKWNENNNNTTQLEHLIPPPPPNFTVQNIFSYLWTFYIFISHWFYFIHIFFQGLFAKLMLECYFSYSWVVLYQFDSFFLFIICVTISTSIFFSHITTSISFSFSR